jgi:hypothetical protein
VALEATFTAADWTGEGVTVVQLPSVHTTDGVASAATELFTVAEAGEMH